MCLSFPSRELIRSACRQRSEARSWGPARAARRKPGAIGRKPGAIGRKPGAVGRKPGAVGRKPGATGHKPGAEHQLERLDRPS